MTVVAAAVEATAGKITVAARGTIGETTVPATLQQTVTFIPESDNQLKNI